MDNRGDWRKKPVMDQWRGKPAHTMVWNSKIAKQCTFIDANTGEDYDWVKQACKFIIKEVRIDRLLYFYDGVLDKTYE
jgi:hypothetical protein